MTASGTSAASQKRVPDGPASLKERLRRIATFAAPPARRRRLPLAQRASDATELVVIRVEGGVHDDVRRWRAVVVQRVLANHGTAGHVCTTAAFSASCPARKARCEFLRHGRARFWDREPHAGPLERVVETSVVEPILRTELIEAGARLRNDQRQVAAVGWRRLFHRRPMTEHQDLVDVPQRTIDPIGSQVVTKAVLGHVSG